MRMMNLCGNPAAHRVSYEHDLRLRTIRGARAVHERDFDVYLLAEARRTSR
jgi:hypothetical protein